MSLPFGVEPIVPGPGQESCWDYPRPPVLHSVRQHIEIRLGGVLVCVSEVAIRVLETSHPPTYYLPESAWLEGSLRPATGASVCEWKGVASYFDVLAVDDTGGVVAEAPRAAWGYRAPLSPFQALSGHLAVFPAAMDSIEVEGELVQPQLGGFYGGWITSNVVGPFKGAPGSRGW